MVLLGGVVLLAASILVSADEITPAGKRLAEVLDSMNVEQHWLVGKHVNWLTGDEALNGVGVTKGGSTHCSAFAAAAADKLGLYLLRPPEHSDILLASAQQDWLQGVGVAKGWKPVKSPLEAQALANHGEFVVVTFKSPDPKKPGHVAIVRPSSKSEAEVLAEGPQVIQAGKFNHNSTTAKDGFKNHPGAFENNQLRYFVHITAFGAPANVPTGIVQRFLLATNTAVAPVYYYVADSRVTGPTVLVVAGTHGSENAAVDAAEAVLKWKIIHGKFVVLPRANVAAIQAHSRYLPDAPEDERDLDQDFPKTTSDNPHGELATDIWKLVAAYKPDWIVDLHEAEESHQNNPQSRGNTVSTFGDKSPPLAEKILAALNSVSTNQSDKFDVGSALLAGSVAQAAAKVLNAQALVFYTAKAHQLQYVRAHKLELMLHVAFKELGVIAGAPPALTRANFAITNGLPLRHIGVYDNAGSSGKGLVLAFKGLLALTNTVVSGINADDVREGALTNFDVALFPGGNGHIQAAVLGEEGLKNVKSFVQNGGNYIGICAGAYLAISGYPWSLRILNARTISTNWARGIGTVKVEITAKGHEIFGNEVTMFGCHYGNGPVIKPAGLEDLPAFETLAYFRSEMAEHGTPAGIMINSPAIYTAPFGRGRVICFTPHTEMTPGYEWMIGSAVKWLTETKTNATTIAKIL